MIQEVIHVIINEPLILLIGLLIPFSCHFRILSKHFCNNKKHFYNFRENLAFNEYFLSYSKVNTILGIVEIFPLTWQILVIGKNPPGKNPPDSKPNPMPNLILTLPLTPHEGGGAFFRGDFFLTPKSYTIILIWM